MKRTTRRRHRSRVISLLLLAALLSTLWAAGTAGAKPPATSAEPESAPTVLNYQGIVMVDGEPFDGPTGYFKFAIVDAATGDGSTNYWANDGQASGEPIAAIPLPVSEGLFNVLLGDTTLTGMTEVINAAVFATEPAYLRVWFSPTGVPGSYETLDPNQRIASVAFALRAEFAENAPPGPTGATGPSGPAGATGPTGPEGPQGPAGATGATGPQGSQGPEGATGPTGPEGLQGPVGATGPTGPQGTVGATGATGPIGLQGPVGATGPIGPQGTVGAMGATGPIGLDGPVGATGATGPQGPMGTTGATGPIGLDGPVGATGATGPQGVQGPAGTTGPTGPVGATGPQGIQGPVGPAGATGPGGPSGPSGPTGPVNPNADMVDGYHASGTPTANRLIALDASANLRVPRVLDSDNIGYYVDPADTSYLNTFYANDARVSRYYDRNDTNYYADPASTSILSTLDVRGSLYNGAVTYVDVADDLHANRLVDRNNTGFYADPASTSILSTLDVRGSLYNGATTYIDVADDLHANRLVDRDNTAYVVDPASTSSLNHVFGEHFGVNVVGSAVGYFVADSSLNDIDYGLEALYPDLNGVFVGESGADGIYILSPGDDGVHIASATNDGVHVASATDDGLQVETANYGVYVQNANVTGVIANGGSLGGAFSETTNGIWTNIAYRSEGTNYGILSNGTILGSSMGSAQPHPTDTNKMIVYGALEGGETGTYYRGTAQLKDGTARVDLPEHFGLVTEEEGLTVQVTPREDCNGVYVDEVSTTYILVRELMGGSSDARFDFLINGVRAGFRDFAVQADTTELFAAAPDATKAAEMPERVEEHDSQSVPAPQLPDEPQPPEPAEGTGTEKGKPHD